MTEHYMSKDILKPLTHKVQERLHGVDLFGLREDKNKKKKYVEYTYVIQEWEKQKAEVMKGDEDG